jgi:hypothetical protein
MKLLVVSLVLGVPALKLGGIDPVSLDMDPPPYHQIVVGMESVSPDALTVRKNYDESRDEAYNLAALAERSYKGSSQLEALLGENSFLQQFGSKGVDDIPIVDVGLAQGEEHSIVGNTIAEMQRYARSQFSTAVGNLKRSYTTAMGNAKMSMADSVRRHFASSSFIVEEPSFRVDVVPAKSDQGAGSASSQQLFGKKAAALTQLYEGGSKELLEIAKIMSSEFDKALSANVHSSFLEAVPGRAEGYHKQLNIRLVAPTAATISDMLEGAMAREDVSEENLRNQILTLELKLVQQINSFAQDLLKHVSAIA